MSLRRLSLALTLSFVIPMSHAAGEIVIKFSHVVAPDTPKGRAAEKFKELAEKKTAGKVKVQVYPNSQLYKDREEMEALQINAVQMLAPSLSKFGPLGAREFEVFDLPYIFGLAYWDNGFKHFSANKPLKKLEDFKGVKMRIQSSKVLEAQMKAIGANPQVMAFSEVYTALQQGVVDGTENPISNFYTQKMHEVQKHLTLTQHGYLGYGVIVNKKFWEGLPTDIRQKLNEAMQEASKFERDISEKDNMQALNAVRTAKTTEITVMPLEERKRLHQALLPVHKEFEKSIGVDVIRSIYAIAVENEKSKVNK